MVAHSLLSVQEKQGWETRAAGGPAFHLVEMSEKIKLAHGQKHKQDVDRDWGQ